MAQGQSYGRFSGRGTSAYDVMAQAKKMGGAKRSLEAQEQYQEDLDAWLKKKKPWQTASTIADWITPFLLPKIPGLESLKALPLKGLEGEALKGAKATNFGSSMLKNIGGFGLGSIVDMLGSHFAGGVPKFEAPDLGVYGAQFIDPIKKKISGEERDINQQLGDLFTNRLQTSIFKSFGMGDSSIMDWLIK